MTRIVQPALIIGVGGSGIEIARRFKRRFQTLYPDTPYVRFLGIDTAPQVEATEELPALAEEEFIYASNFQMNFYVGEDHVDKHPAIREWWRGYDKIPLKYVSTGAGQRRPVGRLALYVVYPQVVERLRAHLHGIFNDRDFHGLPPQYRRAVNVYVVASTCGGTGTGMFLDLAYLANQLVPECMPGAVAWVRSLLLLPSVFIDTGRVADARHRIGLRANAYAALTELDYAMSRHSMLRPVRYPDGREVSRDEPPFRSCYLVGNRNAEGAVLTDFDEILERAAVHIQIELASPLTETGQAIMDNVLANLAAKPDSQGRPRLYSSFHGDWLELPSRRVLVRWTKRLALRLAERLREPVQGDAVARALRELGSAPGWGTLRSLVAEHAVARYAPSVEAEVAVLQEIGEDGEDASALVQRAAALYDAAQRQIAANGALPRAAEEALGQLWPELEAAARGLLATGSLAAAREFLTRVHADAEAWVAQARGEIGADSPDRWLADFSRRITAVRRGLFGGRKRYAREQRRIVLEAVEQARASWLQTLRALLAGQVLDGLPALLLRLRDLRERLDRLSAVLDSAAAVIARAPEPSVPQAMSVRAASDEDIDRAFEEPARLERLERAAQPGLHGLLEDAAPDVDELARRIWNAAHQAVRAVAPEYLNRLSIPAAEIAERMNRLAPLAIFTAEWNTRPESREVERLWLIGLPESMAGQQGAVRERLSVGRRTEAQIVRHQDEERVILTVQHHGFPLYALAETQECRRAFQESNPADRILRFVLPEDEVRQWDLVPVEPREARQLFALALALGRIRRAGQRYVYNSGSPRSLDIELGAHADPVAAREAARDGFLLGGHSSEVRAWLEARTREEGNGPLYDELGRWLEQQEDHARDPEYPQEFLREIEAVREYRRSIRPF